LLSPAQLYRLQWPADNQPAWACHCCDPKSTPYNEWQAKHSHLNMLLEEAAPIFAKYRFSPDEAVPMLHCGNDDCEHNGVVQHIHFGTFKPVYPYRCRGEAPGGQCDVCSWLETSAKRNHLFSPFCEADIRSPLHTRHTEIQSGRVASRGSIIRHANSKYLSECQQHAKRSKTAAKQHQLEVECLVDELATTGQQSEQLGTRLFQAVTMAEQMAGSMAEHAEGQLTRSTSDANISSAGPAWIVRSALTFAQPETLTHLRPRCVLFAGNSHKHLSGNISVLLVLAISRIRHQRFRRRSLGSHSIASNFLVAPPYFKSAHHSRHLVPTTNVPEMTHLKLPCQSKRLVIRSTGPNHRPLLPPNWLTTPVPPSQLQQRSP
jgi:hypothetical protein